MDNLARREQRTIALFKKSIVETKIYYYMLMPNVLHRSKNLFSYNENPRAWSAPSTDTPVARRFRPMQNSFTAEQATALAAFESAAESNDLHAIGSGRKTRAQRDVVMAHAKLVQLGVADALTPHEQSTVTHCRAATWQDRS